MKVILNSNIEKLGIVGDVVEVKSGYARNFLFPKGFALEVNKHNLEIIEHKRKKIQKKLELEKLSATEQKEKLDAISLTIAKKSGENDVLFGSVTIPEIEEKLEEMGIKLERKKFHLDEPIKRLGNYTCKVKLFEDVVAELKIEVVQEGEKPGEKSEDKPEEESAEEQEKKPEEKPEEKPEDEASEEEPGETPVDEQ